MICCCVAFVACPNDGLPGQNACPIPRGDRGRVAAHGFLAIAHSAVASASVARPALRKRLLAPPPISLSVCLPLYIPPSNRYCAEQEVGQIGLFTKKGRNCFGCFYSKFHQLTCTSVLTLEKFSYDQSKVPRVDATRLFHFAQL